MHMTGPSGILSVPPEHLPGLIALAIIPLALWLAVCAVNALAIARVSWAKSTMRVLERLSFGARAALIGLVVGAVVHAVLVPTHWQDAHVTALLFVADTVGFIFALVWTLGQRRRWEIVDVMMLVGTAAGYALYLIAGWETADPVGLLTTTIELASGILLLASVFSTGSDRRPSANRWLGVAAVAVALVSLLGVSAIGSQLANASPTPSVSTSGSIRATRSPVAPVSGSVMDGMQGNPSSTTTALHLATTSPAGDVVWPVDMKAMAPGMEMATPNCHARPTAAQQEAATRLVDQTVAAVAPYRTLESAKEAGYVPITPSGQKIVHYINPTIYQEGNILDPTKVPVLVYVNTAHGAVLSAAMYLMPRDSSEDPPQPGGCLTQWHIHSNLCFNDGGVVGRESGDSCGVGSVNRTTAPMMHVWMTPVTGGPLVPDPSPVSQVEAAVQMETGSPINGTA
jgi:hypothetical protein